MFRRSVVILALVLFVALLFAEIGTANLMPGISNTVQFGGRQAVYASGDTIAICYVQYTDLNPTNMGALCYSVSYDGGQTFQTTVLGYSWTIDGAPTLLKEGQTVIITYSTGGYIKWAKSEDNGANFIGLEPVRGSDRLPITDKYEGEYHSLYSYQDFTPDFYKMEGMGSGFYSNFIQTASSSNDTPTYYWGPDVVYGKVRVNGDLWIKQAGGGTNNGWPTFYSPVIVSGQIQSYSGTPPYAQIFREGYDENIPEVPLGFANIPAYAQIVGPVNYDPSRITMVTVNGDFFTSLIGIIHVNGFDTLWVYSDYPPGNGAPLYANIIPHADTLWVEGPSGFSAGNETFMVNSLLWIKGTFSGTQVWYSPDNIFLMDDILLTNTPVGQAPDGSVSGSTMNTTDKVAIVSGKSIYIQYGYKDPVSGNRMKPNCDGDAQGIWVYASLYALGDGDGNSREDGVFTFEYQHPHPSVPAVNIDNTLYDKIDLHRRTYPQTTGIPWPGNIDYPYYNPLWPEGNPYMERGTVHVFGSIIQRRRGFMHRSLADTDYPNPTNLWNIELDLCGGPSGMAYVDPVLNTTFAGVNAPGATGAGVGYKKDFRFDNRIKSDTFGFNPWDFGIRVDTGSEIGEWQTEASLPQSMDMVSKTYDRKYGQTLFSMNDRLFRYHDNGLAQISMNPGIEGNIAQINLLDEEHALIYVHDKNIGLSDQNYTPDTLRVFILNLSNGSSTPLAEGFVPSEMNDIAEMDNGLKLFAKTNSDDEVQLYAINQDSQLIQLSTWNPNQSMLSSDNFDFSKARLTLIPSGEDSLYVLIWLPLKPAQYPWLPDLNNGIMFVARGEFDNTGNDDDNNVPVPELKPTVSCSPNPFRNNATIKVNLPENSDLAVNIYNTKGELIKSFNKAYKRAGSHNMTWDGKDNQGKTVSSGMYYYRCETERNIDPVSAVEGIYCSEIFPI
jgi:hypothetical protein